MKRLWVRLAFTIAALMCFVNTNTGVYAYGSERRLSCKHVSEDLFYHALKRARGYDGEAFAGLTAGVVPHHLTAAALIGGFFNAAGGGGNSGDGSGNSFDTVIIVGPNHSANPLGGDEVTVSFKGWDAPGNAECDTEIIKRVTELKLTDGVIREDDARMEDDHAVSALVPFINYYWPEAKVAPLLVGRSLTYGDTLKLADGLTEIITASGKRALLLCSIDFSHYLTPGEARIRDAETLGEIQKAGYEAIHSFTDANADSPASLIIFLRYLENTGGAVNVIDNTDASEFTNVGREGTTSYFVLIG